MSTSDRSATPPGPSMRPLIVLLGTQTLSRIGSSTTGFALALWMYGRSGSVTLLGLMLLATSLPSLLVGPYAGTIADRLPRRLTMLGADTVAALVTGTIGLLAWSGQLEPVHVIALVALGSVADSFQEPAFGALVGEAAPSDQLERLNGVTQLGSAISIVAGPATAGVLLAAGGLGLVVAVDLVTYIAATVALALLRFGDERRNLHTGADRPRIREGWQALLAEPGLLRISLTSLAVNLLFGLVNVLLVPLLLGFTDEARAGVVMSLMGVGMVAGSSAIAILGRRGRGGWVIGGGIAVVGLGVVLAGLRPSLWVVAAAALVIAVPVPVVGAVARSLTQRAIEPVLLGRVMALRRTLAVAAMPLAHLGAGPLVDGWLEPAMTSDGGLSTTLGAVIGTGPGRGAAAVFVICGLGVVLLGLRLVTDRHVRELDERLSEPVAVEPRPEPRPAPSPAHG
jgi:DHA3 family macrolide efflux protein-like MFS transporter